MDAISGATVTVIAQNQVMQLSGQAVARQTGIIAPTVREPRALSASRNATTGPQLVQMGAVQQLLVQARAGGPGARPRALHRAVVWRPQPSRRGPQPAGRQRLENSLRSRLKPEENAFFVIRTRAPSPSRDRALCAAAF